ncbi:MAG: lipoyl(octanoyl) transferase LipB [Kineosporiaceae bacterium]|nr:lipoyl(octanoyl) transferase LipB [Kineosporiaceae bacterium]
MSEVAFEVVGIGADRVDYQRAWDHQRVVHEQVCSGQRPNTVLLLEHPPVYTAGKRTEPREHPDDGTPVIAVDRGGKITWHGPGQLVGYPIVRLPDPVDVVAYVRRLEEALIGICADLGVSAGVVKGRTGVWIAGDPSGGTGTAGTPAPITGVGPVGAGVTEAARRDRKIAAIGIRVSRGVTMHGFAINANPDLSAFGRIIPCGIDDADVTSLSAELGREVTVSEILPITERHLRATLGRGLTPRRARISTLSGSRS